MTWLNEHEVEHAAFVFEDDPVLGPATRTLQNLVECVNRCSDGWPYWAPPSRAAAKLQQIVGSALTNHHRNVDQVATVAEVRKALVPIKSFLTRKGLTCEVVAP